MATAGIERMLVIVDAVVAGASSVDDVRAATELPNSTLYRLIGQLVDQNVLQRNRAGLLSMGMRVRSWSTAATLTPLVRTNYALLRQLRDRTGESVQLFRRVADHCLCSASVEPEHGLRDTVPVGTSLPLVDSAAGKVLLAWAVDQHRYADADVRELARVREQGHAVAARSDEPGVLAVAVPVSGPNGEVAAALCISGPTRRIRPQTAALCAVLDAAAARF